MASVLAALAQEHRSFAGPGAYESQIPFKTFLGQTPLVPLKSAMEALDAMQKGHASPRHKAAAQDALKSPRMPADAGHGDACKTMAMACMAIKDDKDHSKMRSCLAQVASKCLAV